jgi:hypothetical protein
MEVHPPKQAVKDLKGTRDNNCTLEESAADIPYRPRRIKRSGPEGQTSYLENDGESWPVYRGSNGFTGTISQGLWTNLHERNRDEYTSWWRRYHVLDSLPDRTGSRSRH